jgi:hypothetical protein
VENRLRMRIAELQAHRAAGRRTMAEVRMGCMHASLSRSDSMWSAIWFIRVGYAHASVGLQVALTVPGTWHSLKSGVPRRCCVLAAD